MSLLVNYLQNPSPDYRMRDATMYALGCISEHVVQIKDLSDMMEPIFT